MISFFKMKRFRPLFYLLLALFLGALAGLIFGKVFHVPRVKGVERFTPPKTTTLYDREGQPYATYAVEERFLLKPGELPFILKTAVLAAEDAHFYRHGGVHVKSVVRAILHDIRTRSYSQGASTITQQLARMLFLTPKKTIKRKIEEALLAFDLEKRLTKEEILTMYCNQIFLGSGSYGVASASRRFFNKSPENLQIHEASLLAGVIQLPSRYNPFRHPEKALARRNWVIQRLHELGYLTQEQAEEIKKRPLDLKPEHVSVACGRYFAEEVRRYLEKTYGTDALYRQGLNVRTTLHEQLQRVAEVALKKQLHWIDEQQGYRHEGVFNVLKEHPDLSGYQNKSWKYLTRMERNRLYPGVVMEVKRDRARVRVGSWTFVLSEDGYEWTGKRLNDLLKVGDVAGFYLREEGSIKLSQVPFAQGAVVIMENSTGQVLAMVGGYDYSRSEFNRATQAMRQAGSAFKPFIYATALEQGWSWSDTIFDGPIYLVSDTGLPDYSPENYYKQYNGIVTLRKALEHSLNVCAVKLFLLVKPENVIRTAHQCGVTPEIPPYASSALGASEFQPLELTAAYTVFPNLGTHVKPHLVTDVTREGVYLEQNTPETVPALHPTIAYLMTSALEGVVKRGTGAAASRIPLPLAGKTGTTNDYTDAWFIGYSPSYTVGVWVGRDKKLPLGKRMPGATAALPVWMEIMGYIEENKLEPVDRFSVPSGISFAKVDAETGLLAGSGCTHVIQEVFLPGTQPQQSCGEEWHRRIHLPYYLQYAFYTPKPGEIMGNEYTEQVKQLIEEGYFEELENGKNREEK